jgi:cytochrome c5
VFQQLSLNCQPKFSANMKKVFVIVFLSAALWACSKKTAPTAATPSAPEAPKEAPAPPAPPTPNDLPAAPDLAAGKQVFEAKCGRCHALKSPGDYPAAAWTGIMDKMAPKARLTEAEKQNVLAYAQANAKK